MVSRAALIPFQMVVTIASNPLKQLSSMAETLKKCFINLWHFEDGVNRAAGKCLRRETRVARLTQGTHLAYLARGADRGKIWRRGDEPPGRNLQQQRPVEGRGSGRD